MADPHHPIATVSAAAAVPLRPKLERAREIIAQQRAKLAETATAVPISAGHQALQGVDFLQGNTAASVIAAAASQINETLVKSNGWSRWGSAAELEVHHVGADGSKTSAKMHITLAARDLGDRK